MDSRLEQFSHSLSTKRDLNPLLERVGGAAAVLIGTASHGASEPLRWRAHITRRLIEEKGFSFVAIEADWPSCYQINRFVKGMPGAHGTARAAIAAFNRWPTWMWANSETLQFIEWLARFNSERPVDTQVGFYGIDLSNLWDSLSSATEYLADSIPDRPHDARHAYECLLPFRDEIDRYPWTTEAVPALCREALSNVLFTLEHLPPSELAGDSEEALSARQNALSAVHAERYYRDTAQESPDSWNVREEHMAHIFFNLLNFYAGKPSGPKGVIWAHDMHAGDVRATDAVDTDRVSLGQIVRGSLSPADTCIVGSGFYQGNVLAAADWNRPLQQMTAPPAIRDSWEALLHDDSMQDRLLLFSQENGSEAARETRDHREIGVIYDPNAEFGNYVPTIIGERYDAFLFIDTVSAVHPLPIEAVAGGPPSTYPSAA
ncbi:MAG TPA: erythromycin esterase family protein [Candidatus Aquicultor sp.]|jgi:erythromycin esterase-like protein